MAFSGRKGVLASGFAVNLPRSRRKAFSTCEKQHLHVFENASDLDLVCVLNIKLRVTRR